MPTAGFDAATLARDELRARLVECGPGEREPRIAEAVEVWLADVDELLRALDRHEEADVLLDLDPSDAFEVARALFEGPDRELDAAAERAGREDLVLYCRCVLEELTRWI